jgi:hypothetical protein
MGAAEVNLAVLAQVDGDVPCHLRDATGGVSAPEAVAFVDGVKALIGPVLAAYVSIALAH